ncbi:MAG: haloacid dehalogenase, partial [Frankia sp.]|nr:haloacid dehalogenase [Frankia sp.]
MKPRLPESALPERLLRRLERIEGVVFDVDGCLMLADQPGGHGGSALAGAAGLVAALRRAGRRVVVFTNASDRPPAEVAASLRAAGLPFEAADVLTPSVVAAEVVRQRYGEAPVLAFGGSGLLEVLAAGGVR